MSEPEAPKQKSKPKRARRSYAEDCRELQSRIDTATRLLLRAKEGAEGVPCELIAVAIETLRGVEP